MMFNLHDGRPCATTRSIRMVAPSACCRSSFAIWTQLSLTRTSLSKRPGVICTMRAEFRRAERDEGLSLPELSFVINEKIEILNDWTSRWCTGWRTLCLLVPRDMFSRTSRNIPEWMGLYTDAVSRFELLLFSRPAAAVHLSCGQNFVACRPRWLPRAVNHSMCEKCDVPTLLLCRQKNLAHCQTNNVRSSAMCLHSCSAVRESLHESALGVHLNFDKHLKVSIYVVD